MTSKLKNISLITIVLLTFWLFGLNLYALSINAHQSIFSTYDVSIFNKVTKASQKPGNKAKTKHLAKNNVKPDKQHTSGFVTHVTLTTYQPVASQCDATPDITANGTKIDFQKLKRKEIKYCAISRDLLPYIKMGDYINIDGYGKYLVCDLMNKRFTHCVDIMIHPDDNNTFKEYSIRIKSLS